MQKLRPHMIVSRIFIALLLLFSGLNLATCQNKADDLSFDNRFEQVSADNIFKTEGFHNWGASVIKGEDGKYHLFYSRWPAQIKGNRNEQTPISTLDVLPTIFSITGVELPGDRTIDGRDIRPILMPEKYDKQVEEFTFGSQKGCMETSRANRFSNKKQLWI